MKIIVLQENPQEIGHRSMTKKEYFITREKYPTHRIEDYVSRMAKSYIEISVFENSALVELFNENDLELEYKIDTLPAKIFDFTPFQYEGDEELWVRGSFKINEQKLFDFLKNLIPNRNSFQEE